MLQEAGHIKNIVVLIFQHIQCLHLINFEVGWVLASSRTQSQQQIILDPDYLPDYLSVSNDYEYNDLTLLSCNKRNIYWLRNKFTLPKISVWSQILMLLKECINNTSNELSDITFKLFFFRKNCTLPASALDINIV